ncbi:MAG: hypothetical protein IT233_06675 [Bacteroidia bacterium]|nr:hypothetical protein [Bacteroidia bacterium]
MLKKIVILLALLLPLLPAAQNINYRGSEFGLGLGAGYYLGELNRKGHFSYVTRPAAGLIYRYNINPRFSFKGNLVFGTLQGDDSRTGVPSSVQRNAHFKSPVTELAAEIEFNFLNYVIGNHKTYFTPFVFGGIGLFRFNPKAQLGNNWVALQPLGTEGQGSSLNGDKKYALIQPALPFGLGVKAWISSRIGITVEWGWRKTFTDYIDDVSKTYVDPTVLAVENGPVASYFSDTSLTPDNISNVGKQRGDATDKDWYSFALITLSFKLKNKVTTCSSYR